MKGIIYRFTVSACILLSICSVALLVNVTSRGQRVKAVAKEASACSSSINTVAIEAPAWSSDPDGTKYLDLLKEGNSFPTDEEYHTLYLDGKKLTLPLKLGELSEDYEFRYRWTGEDDTYQAYALDKYGRRVMMVECNPTDYQNGPNINDEIVEASIYYANATVIWAGVNINEYLYVWTDELAEVLGLEAVDELKSIEAKLPDGRIESVNISGSKTFQYRIIDEKE